MDEKFYIGGKHAVLHALNNPNRLVHEVFITKKDADIKFKRTKIVDKNFFNKIFNGINLNHQNTAALVSPLKNYSLKTEVEKEGFSKLVILNGISDQRNIGSIIRSVLAFNFDGIILENKFFNQKNPLMIKASSGAIEYLKIFSVTNIKNEIKTLKNKNFYVIGMDSKCSKNFFDCQTNKKIAIIFGSENVGIQKTVKQKCHEIFKIPINEKIKSLNVSNAVAATLVINNFKNN